MIGAPEDLVVEDDEVATDDVTVVLDILPHALRVLDREEKRLGWGGDGCEDYEESNPWPELHRCEN